ncbi:MAG: FAD-dependent oxidoreductase [Trebonia sp.]
MAGDTYDVIVIGAGPTGENVADRAVRCGLSAVIVESELVGGECSYWACMPSKALLRPAAVVAEAGRVRGVSGARIEPAGVLARRDSFTNEWKDDSQVDWLNGAKISLVRGHGRLTGERQVTVGDVTLTARQAVVVATGTNALVPPVLAAVGRTPNTGDIGLETVGLADGSWLGVDDTMRVTDVPGGWLYACGDVNHLALLTHMGKYQGRLCGDAIGARAAGREPTVRDVASRTRVPQVIFAVPEVAAVGLTAEQAEDAGMRVRVVEFPIGDVAGASLFADGYRGRAQMVVDIDRRVIVGLTLAGPGVGEMIHAATIAVVGEVPLDRLRHAVPAFPTMSELWLRLLETYGL